MSFGHITCTLYWLKAENDAEKAEFTIPHAVLALSPSSAELNYETWPLLMVQEWLRTRPTRGHV